MDMQSMVKRMVRGMAQSAKKSLNVVKNGMKSMRMASGMNKRQGTARRDEAILLTKTEPIKPAKKKFGPERNRAYTTRPVLVHQRHVGESTVRTAEGGRSGGGAETGGGFYRTN